MISLLLVTKNPQNQTPKFQLDIFLLLFSTESLKTSPKVCRTCKSRAEQRVSFCSDIQAGASALCFLPRIERIWRVRTLQCGVNSICTRLCQIACTSCCCTEIGVHTECLICIQVLKSRTTRLSLSQKGGEQWRLLQAATHFLPSAS